MQAIGFAALILLNSREAGLDSSPETTAQATFRQRPPSRRHDKLARGQRVRFEELHRPQ
jgi:hypothetical protein